MKRNDQEGKNSCTQPDFYSLPGFQFPVPGSWFSVLGSQFLVLGCWFLVLGSWFSVLGSWFLVLSSRSPCQRPGNGAFGRNDGGQHDPAGASILCRQAPSKRPQMRLSAAAHPAQCVAHGKMTQAHRSVSVRRRSPSP